MLQEFLQKIDIVVYSRSRKMGKRGQSLRSGLSGLGWWLEGSGYFGECWMHRDYPDLVLKISGPSGWGEWERWDNAETAYSNSNGRGDSWQRYAEFIYESEEENKPKGSSEYFNAWPVVSPDILAFKRVSEGIAYAVMPRYSHIEDYDDVDTWSIKLALQGSLSPQDYEDIRNDSFELVRDLYTSQGYTLDLHKHNVMLDLENRRLVLTDPFGGFDTGSIKKIGRVEIL